ncbi:tyrosine-type recombinase/integrase [Deinococcus radiophilus]|uniref:tyrosine-type recombinase/integrase n=1 Tax=Deinococcus radiophilus TaxID=32062 RepID=UPI001E5EA549|nr:site-specific integrase [Deinococcus radiophilus]UFA51716.1 tyrosine-type recombinase/integrase [Deinococcus radiophilus]
MNDSSTFELVRFQDGPLGNSREWAELPQDERRRRAVLAGQTYDPQQLWSLTEAHLALFGKAGAAISSRTLRTYRQGIARYLDFAQVRAVSLLRPSRDSGALYIRTLEAEGLAPSTVQVHLAAARAFYKALRWAGVTDSDPLADLSPAPDNTAPWDKRQPYRDDELLCLLGYAGLRDRVLILLCAHGGLRISEAVALKWSDVQLSAAQMTVTGKGRKVRNVHLSASLKNELLLLNEQTQPGGQEPVIGATQTAARQRLRRLCQESGVRYLGWHAMRHYAGTRLTRQTGNLEHAARHLGHSSLETTRIYAKWADDALNEALEGW